MTDPGQNSQKRRTINLVMAIAAAQVGCLTLIIVLAAVLGGLWLDNRFSSKPMFTFILIIASIPISVVVMLVVARAAVKRIQPPKDGGGS